MNVRKRILKKTLEIGAIIVLEGVLSIVSQGAREISKNNYWKSKEKMHQIKNLRKNKSLIDCDWDLL